MNCKLFLTLAVSPLLFGCASDSQFTTFPPIDPPTTNGLQMSLAISKSQNPHDPILEITFRNLGEPDLLLNLGYTLANGKVQLPAQIHLQLVDADGRIRQLDFFDKRYPGISGRVDDFIVPLRAGSSYTLQLRLDQFWSPDTKEFQLKLNPGCHKISAWFQCGNPEPMDGRTTVKLATFWQGKIQSNISVLCE